MNVRHHLIESTAPHGEPIFFAGWGPGGAAGDGAEWTADVNKAERFATAEAANLEVAWLAQARVVNVLDDEGLGIQSRREDSLAEVLRLLDAAQDKLASARSIARHEIRDDALADRVHWLISEVFSLRNTL